MELSADSLSIGRGSVNSVPPVDGWTIGKSDPSVGR